MLQVSRGLSVANTSQTPTEGIANAPTANPRFPDRSRAEWRDLTACYFQRRKNLRTDGGNFCTPRKRVCPRDPSTSMTPLGKSRKNYPGHTRLQIARLHHRLRIVQERIQQLSPGPGTLRWVGKATLDPGQPVDNLPVPGSVVGPHRFLDECIRRI